jgi:valyl-tRNA synthetase
MPWIEQFGADGVRYWAASGRPGVDTVFDEGQMKVGRRLAIKILNASRFVLSVSGGDDGGLVDAELTTLDRSATGRLASVVNEATVAFDGYDYARALERTEAFFWTFCDDYVELVKSRAYGGQGEGPARSARRTLNSSLSVLLRLFAPFLPFVTEEVWSWWRDGSVHRAPWPAPAELGAEAAEGDPGVFAAAAGVLSEVRKAKTEAHVSMRADVARAVVRDVPVRLAAVRAAGDDLRDAGRIAELVLEPAGDGEEPTVDVELVEAASA